MKLYKLTDEKGETQGGCQWGENVTNEIPTKIRGKVLCKSGLFHAYKNQNLGLLLNPIHSDFSNIILWEAEGEICVEDWGKVGTWKLTTRKELQLPDWYSDKKLRNRVCVLFAVLCAESVLHYFEKWKTTLYN